MTREEVIANPEHYEFKAFDPYADEPIVWKPANEIREWLYKFPLRLIRPKQLA